MCARRRRKRTCKKPITPAPYFATLTSRLPVRDNFIFPARPQNELVKRRKKGSPAPPPRFSNRRDLHISRSRFGLICKTTSPVWGRKNCPCTSHQKRRLGGVRVPKNPSGPIWMCKNGPRGKRFSLKFPKAPKKSPRRQPPKKKNRNLLASESVKNLIFQFRTLAKIFPLPTSEMRETVRRNTQNAKKG